MKLSKRILDFIKYYDYYEYAYHQEEKETDEEMLVKIKKFIAVPENNNKMIVWLSKAHNDSVLLPEQKELISSLIGSLRSLV